MYCRCLRCRCLTYYARETIFCNPLTFSRMFIMILIGSDMQLPINSALRRLRLHVRFSTDQQTWPLSCLLLLPVFDRTFMLRPPIGLYQFPNLVLSPKNSLQYICTRRLIAVPTQHANISPHLSSDPGMPNHERVVQIVVSGKSLLVGTGGEGAEWTEEQRRMLCKVMYGGTKQVCIYLFNSLANS